MACHGTHSQNMYPYRPLLEDIISSDTAEDVRIALGQLMFEAVVEVQVADEKLCEVGRAAGGGGGG